MSGASERLFAALGIPETARVATRVAKSLLGEQAGLTAADRRAVETGIERLDWRATLKPASIGLEAFADAERDYPNIVVMTLALREGAKSARLTEIIHRAIAAPLVLIGQDGGGATLSVGLKRRHEREAERAVVERLVVGPPVSGGAGETAEDAFLASLDLARLPARDLWDAHRALAERIEALAAARACGVWRLPADEAQSRARREALARLAAAQREVQRLRRAAAGEKRLAARVALAGAVARAEKALAETIAALR
jgi:hypothetical protein